MYRVDFAMEPLTRIGAGDMSRGPRIEVSSDKELTQVGRTTENDYWKMREKKAYGGNKKSMWCFYLKILQRTKTTMADW